MRRGWSTFRQQHNVERPHEGLGDRTPASLWTPASRPYPKRIAPPRYPAHLEVRRVSTAGTFRLHSQQLFLSQTLKGEDIGLEKVDARLHWLWVFVTADTTVYRILRGRGFEEAATVLGADYAAVVVRDGWAPYPTGRASNLCRTFAASVSDAHPRSARGPLRAARPGAAAACVARARPLSRRRDLAHGVAVARGHLQNQLDVLIDQPGRRRIARNFATHLAIEFPAVFTFLLEPDAIDATNWRAEHALRPAV